MHVAIQDLHPDERDMMVQLFTQAGCTTSVFKTYEGQQPVDTADLLVIAANELGREHVNKKPFMTLCFNKDNIYNIQSFTDHPNFRAVICGAPRACKMLRDKGVPYLAYLKGYRFSNSQVQIPGYYKRVTSLIKGYEVDSGNNTWNGKNAWNEFNKLRNAVTHFSVEHYGSPSSHVNDIETLMTSRYLVHIKYWGFVCNAVVKALALGIPVLMDRGTYEIAFYEGYIQHGENALVFETTEDMIAYLQSAEEPNTYSRLKENCMNQRKKHITPYNQRVIFDLKALLSLY